MADADSLDEEFAQQIADSLRRQVGEVQKLLDAQHKLNRRKELELQKSNERLKAVWVIKVLRFQKKANEAQLLLEENRKLMKADLQTWYNNAQMAATQLKLRQQDRIALLAKLEQTLSETYSYQETSPLTYFEGSGHSGGESTTQHRPTVLLTQLSSPVRSDMGLANIQRRVSAHLKKLKIYDFEDELSSCQPTAIDQMVSGIAESSVQEISSISFCNPQNSFQNSTFHEDSAFPWLSFNESKLVISPSESSSEDLRLLPMSFEKEKPDPPVEQPKPKRSFWKELCCCRPKHG